MSLEAGLIKICLEAGFEKFQGCERKKYRPITVENSPALERVCSFIYSLQETIPHAVTHLETRYCVIFVVVSALNLLCLFPWGSECSWLGQ